jgi:signal transduction histidine kinase
LTPLAAFAPLPALNLLLSALTAAGLVGLGLLGVERVRTALRPRRVDPWRPLPVLAAFLALQVGAGAAVGALLAMFAGFLGRLVPGLPFDAAYLALHPWNPTRLAAIAGLLVLQGTVCWLAVGVLTAALLRWRIRRHAAADWLLVVGCWLGAAALVLAGAAGRFPLPLGAALLVASVVVGLTVVLSRGVGWFRRGSQALRLGASLVAVVLPALLLYPSLSFYAERQKADLIERQYASEAMTHPQALKRKLDDALGQIDRQQGLGERLRAITPSAPPSTDAAFLVWQHTVLATERLTSAVELYSPTGRLVSRFALNFPEYAARAPRYEAVTCAWEIFGEAASFGAEERRMLHAERAVCESGGHRAGSLVVHVMPDYDVLSFISARNPYFELLRGAPASEARLGAEVGLAIYGWGRTPIYTSTGRAWPLGDEVFRRVYASRTPFWVTLPGPERDHRVYFANDRFGIYALDYPLPSTYDHFVHLAEIATLASLGFIALVVVAGVVRRVVWTDARPGRRLLREIRASFYRKVFLAFVAASVVPALILALLIRAFVAARLRADVEAEAARTVTVAQRLTEETLALQPSAEPGLGVLSDDLLVWVSRVLDQAVNVFDGPQLVATSERDLFASGLLPTRVPAPAYRAVVLDRLPSFVGEDRMGNVRYLMAAAPVRAIGSQATLTVPLALRQREIEREIDDLDRGVQLGALLFVLVGAGLGFWLAERIADPVQRLTRASRRIAAGDLDARVFVRTADELQRLVESFNAMAFELQRQRAQLERTNRLEAWAEMARQVAHDIKNPLTPIQLSTEHLRRVHRDRGEPLGDVLESCTTTILSQVRLLRQIAGEFSSFATTPAPRPVATDVRGLLEEVLQAYATGLEGRVAVSLSTDPDLPELMVDRTLIGRAITNVIENALHAMPTGGRLDVRAVRADDAVAIDITDTGVGMDDEALSMMFEPYFSTKAIGTGLGLTIAKRNVELHGGAVAISSRKGAGTTVRLTLPVTAGEGPGRAAGDASG